MQYSIVNLSEVKNASNDFLIHAEFFHPKIQKFRKYAKNNDFQKLENYVGYVKRGAQPLYSNFGTIPVLKSVNIRECGITEDRQEYVDENFFKSKKQSQVNYKDVLLTSTGVGTLGRCLINQNNNKYFIDGHITILNNLKELLPEFLYIYLNSKYGQEQINVLYKGSSGQIEIYPDNIKQILIKPLKIQQSIASLVNTSYTLRQSADTLYKEAEEILLEELGLKNYQPQNKKCFVKMLSDTQEAGRIDAEYFQPKYEDVIDKIKKYKNGFLFFEDKDINDKNFNPKKDIKYKYIELANISGNSSIDGVENIIGCDLPTRARRIVKADDLIVSSIEGSLNSIALISKKLDGALCSTGFFIVNSNKINSEALLAFLKSNLGQMQLKRGCKGTILTAISKDELKNLIVPLLPQSIQSQISAKIQQSFESREKSKQLLEVAKRAVEIAIEENEEAGLKYIEENK